MASVKVKFRHSSADHQEGTIVYQILHERRQRQYSTEYHIYSTEWDETRNAIREDKSKHRRAFILSLKERIRWDLERLG